MRILAILLAVFALSLPNGAAAQIKLPSIKNGLIELALSQVSSPGSFEITAGSIEDGAEGGTSLLDVQVADDQGVWMTVERVSFAWDPSAILGGELAITKLELVGLTVSRPPSATAEAPELKPVEDSGRGLFDWPRAPIDLSIEGVKLERISIAEGVLPQAIAFDASARAFDKGDLQELSLTLTRNDGIAGDIALAMRRDFAANTVKLEVRASEAAGGIVAAAAGLPMDAPARLTLNAEGPPEDWKLVFDAGVERVFDAEGRATLAYADRLSVDADFSVTPGPAMSETTRTVLGERATLKAQVAEREDGRFEVISGALASPALTLKASGAFAAGAGESDLKISLAALPPLAALADGVEFQGFSFDGQVSGPQGALVAEGDIGLNGLRTEAADAGSLTLAGRVAQAPGGLTFRLDGTGAGLRADKLGPEVIGDANLGAEGVLEGDLLTLQRAALDSRSLKVEAAGRYDLAASGGDLSLGMSVPAIGPVAGAYGVTAEGSVGFKAEVKLAGADVDAVLTADLSNFAMDPVAAEKMTIEGRVIQNSGGLGFDVSGAGRGLVLDQVPRDLTRDLTLTASGNMNGGALALEALRLAMPLVTAEASGSLNLEAGAADIDYHVKTADLQPVAQAYGADAEGALDATGKAAGAFDALLLTGSAAIGEARFEGRGYGQVELTHAVTVGAAPEGDLAVKMKGGELGDGSVATRFRLDGPALTLEGIKARLLGIAADGQAALDLESSLAQGKLSFTASDLGTLGPFTGTPMTGAAKGQVTLTAQDGRQNMAADLTLSGAGTDGATVDKAALRLALRDLTGALNLDLKLTASGVDAGGAELASLQAQAAGPLSAIAFSAGAEGALGRDPLRISMEGKANAGGAVTTVTLARADVIAGPEKVPDTIRLRQPLSIRIGDSVTAEGLDLDLPEGGRLTGKLAQHPGGFAGDLALAALPLAVLERWASAPVKAGLLEAKAVFDTRPGRAMAEFAAQGRGIGFEQTVAASGLLDLDLDADWNGAKLQAQTELRGDFGDPVRAQVSLPLRPGPGGVPVVPKLGALYGSLAWTGDIGDFWALVPAAGHMLDGHADIDLRIGGSLEAPAVSGKVELTEGGYQNLDLGTILTGLTLTTDITERGDVQVAMTASDGAKGTLAADVSLLLGGQKPALDMTARIDRAVLVRRDDVTAKISGDLAMDGPLNDLSLKGALKIEKAEVRLIAAPPAEVTELDGIRIKGAPEPEGNGDGDSILTLDMTITAPNDLFVRGRGIESEWKLDLAITGDAAQPVVTGEIERVRGRLNLLGRAFELVRGRIGFDGGREIDPQIDVALEREANGIRGGIVVEGRASDPELHFASVPALPEDEVMPRLLFGQSKQSLSGPQAIQLAAGIATLMSGKAGPLDRVREAAGIDVLRIEGETAETATVTVGRNLGDGIFVGAKQGLQGQGSAVTVEVDVFDGVKVDSEIKQEGGSNVGITWRKDF
jgi:autotransporter translocation and assembly factor TamB